MADQPPTDPMPPHPQDTERRWQMGRKLTTSAGLIFIAIIAILLIAIVSVLMRPWEPEEPVEAEVPVETRDELPARLPPEPR